MKNIQGLIKVVPLIVSLLAAVILISSCGGEGAKRGKNGQFVDSPVIGISYSTSSGKKGTTDEEGKFSYKKGDTVTFYIGALELPQGIPQDDGYITPAHLAGTAEWQEDMTALNIIQFLLSIDADQKPNNGIQIHAAMAESTNDILGGDMLDFSDEAFESFLQRFVSDLANELEITLDVVSREAAAAHFNATIETLGITLVVEAVSDTLPCDSENTLDVQGTWTGDLNQIRGNPTYLDSQTIVVTGSEMFVSESSISVMTCSYTPNVVQGVSESDSWEWLDGDATYTLVITKTPIAASNFTISENAGLDVSSGAISQE